MECADNVITFLEFYGGRKCWLPRPFHYQLCMKMVTLVATAFWDAMYLIYLCNTEQIFEHWIIRTRVIVIKRSEQELNLKQNTYPTKGKADYVSILQTIKLVLYEPGRVHI